MEKPDQVKKAGTHRNIFFKGTARKFSVYACCACFLFWSCDGPPDNQRIDTQPELTQELINEQTQETPAEGIEQLPNDPPQEEPSEVIAELPDETPTDTAEEVIPEPPNDLPEETPAEVIAELPEDDIKDTADNVTPEQPGDQQQEPSTEQTQECPKATLAFSGLFRRPAGGHEIIVRAEDNDGQPWTGNSECLAVTGNELIPQPPYVISQQPLAPGITLIVVNPGAKENAPVYANAIQHFIETRPDKERIAVYGWGHALSQITDFTVNRQRLISQLDRLNRITGSASPLSAQTMFDDALEIAQRVEDPTLRGMRSVLFIAGNLTEPINPVSPQGVSVQWILPPAAATGLTPGHVVKIDTPDMLADALKQVSEQLDVNAAEAFYKISVCADPNEGSTITLADTSGSGIAIDLPKSLKEERVGSCDPEDIAATGRKPIDTINLFLNDEQLEVYYLRLQQTDELEALGWVNISREGYGVAKDKFDIQITLDPSQTPIDATAHFRGQNAMFCDRKSYTINLSGKKARFFDEDAGNDEFYLISMCQDAGLFKGFVGDTLYAQYGLFPLRLRYVEVLLNGETQGVYLLMEKRDEELQKDSARLRGVVRRRYGSSERADIKYAADDNPETLIAAYTEMLDENANIGAAELPAYLRERMDLEQHLRWIGVNSLIENADSSDECLFISTETIDQEGNPMDYFQIMGWDPEDMQGVCRSLWPSPGAGLSFCQQNAFEQRLLQNPEIQKNYAAILKTMLAEVTPERYQAILDQARDQLFPLLERPGVAAAMLLPDVTDAASAKSRIQQRMNQSQQRFEARHARLISNLQAYEAAQQTP